MTERPKNNTLYDFGSDVYDLYSYGVGEAPWCSPQPQIRQIRLAGEKYISSRITRILRKLPEKYVGAQLNGKEIVIYAANDWRILPPLDVRDVNSKGHSEK